MTIDEMIAVLQEAKAGKAIQSRHKLAAASFWSDECAGCGVAHPCKFNFGHYDYRVKPEPREFYVYPDAQEPSVHNGYWFGVARTKPSGGGGIHVREVL